MSHMDYWHLSTNPKTGAKFERFYDWLHIANNGDADVDALVKSDYGKRLTALLQRRFLYEEDPIGPESLAFLESIGLKKEMKQAEDFYERWAIYTPLDMAKDFQYPLVFMLHGGGNDLEVDEYSAGFLDIAAKERFITIIPQNTNWQNISRLIDEAAATYPIDLSRVYIAGYSQGGTQVNSAVFRIPEKLAAAAPCGTDVFRTWDNHNIAFTQEEYKRTKELQVPIIQIVGACESAYQVPFNDWHPRKDWGRMPQPEIYEDPRKKLSVDPTKVVGGKRPFSDLPKPPQGADIQQWMMERLDMRMDTMDCERRDHAKCLSYLENPDSELHHVLGIYGDEESTPEYYGYKHYSASIFNRKGILAYKLIAVENCVHWPLVTMGDLSWEFFKRYKRNINTGELVEETYKPDKLI